MLEALQTWLPTPKPRPLTYPPTILSLLLPWLITYLVHQPDTRSLRLGIWCILTPVAVWTILSIKTESTLPLPWAVITFYSSATRWAFSRTAPSLYPLPHPPPFPPARFLRRTTLFKSVNLLCNESRLTNISPYSPPLQSSNVSWFRYTVYHFCMFSLHLLAYDMTTLPLALLAPDGVGDTFGGGGDYELFLSEMKTKYGVPQLLSRMMSTLELGFTVYHGMALMYHGFAMIGVGSGVWCGEEWPKLMHKPWLSTSLSELWGKRWHQTLRQTLFLFSSPILFLPRIFHPLIIFGSSTIYHHILDYPSRYTFHIYPYAECFMASALGVVAERIFLRITGRRVGGNWGRIWTWAFIFLTAQGPTKMWMENGWAGQMRLGLVSSATSPVEWGLYALGLLPDPRVKRDLWLELNGM